MHLPFHMCEGLTSIPEDLAMTAPVERDTNPLSPSRDEVKDAALDVGGRPVRMEVHSEAAAHDPLRVVPIIGQSGGS